VCNQWHIYQVLGMPILIHPSGVITMVSESVYPGNTLMVAKNFCNQHLVLWKCDGRNQEIGEKQ